MPDGLDEVPVVEGAPLVSVVINAYNVEDYLAECLDSVLAQTFGDFEAIVVDDGSLDATARIAEAYARRDGRIRVLRNERNMGIPATINRALAAARGELVAKLDADEVVTSYHIRDLADGLQALITSS